MPRGLCRISRLFDVSFLNMFVVFERMPILCKIMLHPVVQEASAALLSRGARHHIFKRTLCVRYVSYVCHTLVVARFAGDWRGKRVVFWDPDDEFASTAAAVDEADRLLEEAGFHVAGDPADNKWLSVWPVTSSIGLQQSFHFVL